MPETTALPQMPAPVSPAVPTSVPSSALLQPFSLPTLQTVPAAPPASFAPATPGAVPLALTIDTTVALVLRRNLGAFAALRDVGAAQSSVASARALTPPVLTIGPALQTGGTTDGFLFEQPLEVNGTRTARTDAARARLRLTQAQALVQLQTLVYAAKLYFIALARAQQRVQLTRDLLAAAEQFNALARKQVQLGARPGVEEIQTRVAVGQARLQAAQATGDELAARAAVNAYLGRASADPLSTLPEHTMLPAAPDTLTAQKQSLRRGEVAATLANRDILRAQERLTRAQARPDIAPEFRISEITPHYMDAGLGVVITVPIDYGTRRNQARDYAQQAQAAEERTAGAQAQMRLDAAQAAARLVSAQAVLGQYDAELVTDARALLGAAQAGFQAGGTSVVEVLQAQTVYRTVLADRVDAQAQAAQAQAALEYATGAVPPAALRELEREFGVSISASTP